MLYQYCFARDWNFNVLLHIVPDRYYIVNVSAKKKGQINTVLVLIYAYRCVSADLGENRFSTIL